VATLREVYEAVADSLASAVGTSVVKGFPSWGHPRQQPPVAALLFDGWTPAAPQRIGAGRLQGRRECRLQVYVFGRNEVEMLNLADAVYGWLAQTELVVNGERKALDLFSCDRFSSETGAQQEQYGLVLNMTITV